MPALVTAPPIIVDATNLPAPFGTLTNPFGIFVVGSAMYQVLQSTVSTMGLAYPISVYKSTDGGNTWVAKDTANQPVVAAGDGLVAFFNPTSGNILVLTIGVSSNFFYEVTAFGTGSDTWGAASAASATFSLGNFPGIYQKSTGDIITPTNAGLALQYLTLIAGTWAGPNTLGSYPTEPFVYGVTVDSSDRGHLVFQDHSGNLIYGLIGTGLTLGTPTTLSSSANFDGTSTDIHIWGTNIVISWTEGQTLKVAIGTPLSGASFTTYTVGTVTGSASLSYSFLAVDKNGNLVVFAQNSDTTTMPVTDQLLMWTFDGVSSWGSPVLFYDAIANPPTNHVAPSSQSMFNGCAVESAGGVWTASVQLGISPGGTVSFVLTTGAGVPVLNAPTATGQVNVPYSSGFAPAGGTPPYTVSINAGSLPPGLFLNPTTGAIVGTPTTAGVYNFTGHIVDSASMVGTDLPCTITITQPVVTCAFSVGYLGVAYGSSLTAAGGTAPYAYSITGALPPGLSLNTSTGLISGTPTALGNFPYTAQITDSLGNVGTASCSLTILNVAPVPLLDSGPVQLPANKYRPDTAGDGAQVYGPFTPSNAPNTKVIITIIQSSPDSAPAGNLAAMVSLDNGVTWTEHVGPSIKFYGTDNGPAFNNPAWLNCYRLNDDIFTISSPTGTSSSSGVFGLYSFSLTALAWTTRNAAIATGGIPLSPFILGINSSGIGVAFLYFDPNVNVILPSEGQAQNAPHFMVFNAATGTNLYEGTVFEPDTPYSPTAASNSDWTQLWPFYGGRVGTDIDGTIFGIDSAGNIWASGRQFSYDGTLNRQRTMMWPASPTSVTPVFSVSALTSVDPTTGAINSIAGLQNPTNVYTNALRTSDGAYRLEGAPSVSGANVSQSAKALLLTPNPVLWLGSLAFALGISSSNAGATRTFIINALQMPGAANPTTDLAVENSPTYDPLSGGGISAEISGNFIDVVTKGTIPNAPVDGYSYFTALYYWRISLLGTLSLICPVNGSGDVGIPYDGQVIVSGGTPPYTFETL